MKINLTDIKNQTGVGFGTSGIRSLVTSLTNEVVYIYTYAFLEYLEKIGNINTKSVALAGDLRSSTPHIMAVVGKAIIDKGYQLINCGFVPTPTVTFYGINHQIPSIMVTGSHIPDDRNGIKFNKSNGEVLKVDEAAITAMEIDIDKANIGFLDKLPPVDHQAENDYINRYLNFFPKNFLQGKKIGLYGHSAVGRDIIFNVLTNLGADVTKIGYSQAFVPVDTEVISDDLKTNGQKWQSQYSFDAMVSTDGDSDRPLLSDEQGVWQRSDVIGIPTSKYLNADSIVTAVSCNTALEKSNLFNKIDRVKIGSPYVIAKMNQLVEDGYQSVIGYEANGGFLIASTLKKDNRILKPLPTRDALITILSCLALACESHQQISQIFKDLPSRFTESGSLKGFPTDKSLAIIDKLSQSISDINSLFQSIKLVVKDINTLDGLRITFTNGEIIHFRPSRNSPEFRNYTEADTPNRAKELSQIAASIIESWANTSHL